MKKLLLLRGAPASGKSTFIKDNNLEPYVISSDTLRLMVAGLSMDLDGNMKISQDLDRKVWGFLGEILDERMRYGATTVIDATHNSTKSFKKYKPLVDKYDYKVYCITFTAPIPELMRRNAARPAYKVVPPDCIYTMAHKVESQPTPDWVKDITTLDKFYADETPSDLTNKYDTIKVIGDVHGCFNSLTDAILPLDPQTLYVFCGDYLDRGVQNKATINWFFKHMNDHNIVLLEGNHERHLRSWIDGKLELMSKDSLRSMSEATTTMGHDELNEFDTKLRSFVSRLRSHFSFSYNGVTYFVSHAGISNLPENINDVPAHNFIFGVGKYETQIDELWSKHVPSDTIVQIHGHRHTDSTYNSICLENSVEFGGYLMVATINHDGCSIKGYKNELVYRKNAQ